MEGDTHVGGPEASPIIGIGVRLNMTERGEVSVAGLIVGMPAQIAGVEVNALSKP